MRRRVPSLDKIKQLINYSPAFDLDRALGNIITYRKKMFSDSILSEA